MLLSSRAFRTSELPADAKAWAENCTSTQLGCDPPCTNRTLASGTLTNVVELVALSVIAEAANATLAGVHVPETGAAPAAVAANNKPKAAADATSLPRIPIVTSAAP